MKTIITFIFALLLSGSWQTAKGQSINEIDSTSTLISQLVKKSIQIPIGDSLVLNEFEKEWEDIGIYSDGRIDERSESEKWLTELSNHFYEQSLLNENSIITIDEKYFEKLLNITPSIQWMLFESKMLNKQFKALIISVSEFQNYKLYSIVTERIEFDYIGDFGLHAQIQSLITIADHKIVDNLVVAYSIGNGFSTSDQFFFYDNDIIHIKDFGSDEGWTGFGNYQKYRINPQGKFIQYYEQDGFIKNGNEQGLVKSRTREGKWIEMSNIYYIEKEYKEGVSINDWKYYKMVQNFTEEGKPIFSTRRKGELLYRETYENGALIKRESVK